VPTDNEDRKNKPLGVKTKKHWLISFAKIPFLEDNYLRAQGLYSQNPNCLKLKMV